MKGATFLACNLGIEDSSTVVHLFNTHISYWLSNPRVHMYLSMNPTLNP